MTLLPDPDDDLIATVMVCLSIILIGGVVGIVLSVMGIL